MKSIAILLTLAAALFISACGTSATSSRGEVYYHNLEKTFYWGRFSYLSDQTVDELCELYTDPLILPDSKRDVLNHLKYRGIRGCLVSGGLVKTGATRETKGKFSHPLGDMK